MHIYQQNVFHFIFKVWRKNEIFMTRTFLRLRDPHNHKEFFYLNLLIYLLFFFNFFKRLNESLQPILEIILMTINKSKYDQKHRCTCICSRPPFKYMFMYNVILIQRYHTATYIWTDRNRLRPILIKFWTRK